MTTSFFPIRELSAYHGKWTIKARVHSKDNQLREFKKTNGTGKIFSANLLDQTAEIKVAFFNAAAEKYFDMLKVGKVYTFTRGSVKVANKKFNNTNHPYEITFDSDLVEVAEAEEDKSIDVVKYTFYDLRAVQAKAMPCVVDLCVVVKEHKELVRFTAKSGDNLVKKELVVCDDSGFAMDVTIWAEKAEKLVDAELNKNPVILLKSVNVKEWNERSGSLLSSGGIDMTPSPEKYEQVARVAKWWKEQGSSSKTLVSLSNNSGGGLARKLDTKHLTVDEMKTAANLVAENPEYYTVNARLNYVITTKQGDPLPLFYVACQNKVERNGRPGMCQKRVDDRGYCAACNKEDTNRAPRYNARCQFVDHTGAFYVNLFDNEGEKIFGRPASDFQKEEQEGKKVQQLLRPKYLSQPLKLTMTARIEKYNGEQRTNTRCMNATPLSYAAHGKELLGEIYQMVRMSSKAMEVSS